MITNVCDIVPVGYSRIFADKTVDIAVLDVYKRQRYGYPTKLTLELDPFKPDVYYDLPPKRENRLAGARLLRLS